MSDYKQPDFYRFNTDSLRLIQWLSQNTQHCYSLLDIGAGSGILGLELGKKLRPTKITFLELQEEFLPYLEINIQERLSEEMKSQICISSLGQWRPSEKFDLIVCNPPYYLPGHGQRSDDENRHFCRTFEKDGWGVLLERISEVLFPFGKACLVVKSDPRILSLISHEKLHVKFFDEGNLVFVELTLRS